MKGRIEDRMEAPAGDSWTRQRDEKNTKSPRQEKRKDKKEAEDVSTVLTA